MDHRIEINRRNWNERTPVHAASEFYDVAGFRNGRITLNDIERTEVGSVEGKSLLHLQCHFGMDTMSWARLGAQATGVDISDAAIDLAQALNDELQLNTRFIRSNVYDLPDVLDEEFDIVYMVMGVLCWLPDLSEWAHIIARFLKPNGIFYILDGHPFSHVFESEENQAGVQELRVRYPYFKKTEGEFYEGGNHSYAGSGIIEAGCYEWQHSVGEILNAILDAGLRIQFFHEFAHSGYKAFSCMEKGRDGWWRLTSHNDSVPQLFSLKATNGRFRKYTCRSGEKGG